MKKIIGLIFYILSVATIIIWLLMIKGSVFVKPCINCQYIVAPIVWYKSLEIVLVLIITPLIAFLFYRIGKNLRK